MNWLKLALKTNRPDEALAALAITSPASPHLALSAAEQLLDLGHLAQGQQAYAMNFAHWPDLAELRPRRERLSARIAAATQAAGS